MPRNITIRYPGIESKTVVCVAEVNDVDLTLPLDLKTVCEVFKSTLGFARCYARVVEQPSDYNVLMIEWVGSRETADSDTRLLTLNFIVTKPGEAISEHRTAADPDYTLNRLRLLLIANPTLDNLANIHGIEEINIATGSSYLIPLEDAHLYGGILTVTYRVFDPLARHAFAR